jgi:hypothetical protein
VSLETPSQHSINPRSTRDLEIFATGSRGHAALLQPLFWPTSRECEPRRSPSVASTSPLSSSLFTVVRSDILLVTSMRLGSTLSALLFTPSASVQIVTLTTDGATITQTQAASSITYTSIQAPSYYTVTTSIDALTLTTILPALPGSTIVITQTLPAETQYLTSVTSLPAYTTTITQAASTQVLTSYQAASYYTVTTSVEALTITSVISQQAQTITTTQAASTQFVTQTQTSAASTFYETTTISLDAITRTRTETSIGLSVSSLETTVTGEFFSIFTYLGGLGCSSKQAAPWLSVSYRLFCSC